MRFESSVLIIIWNYEKIQDSVGQVKNGLWDRCHAYKKEVYV